MFDCFNFGILEKKIFIFSFGWRFFLNFFFGLLFGSDGGILFVEEEYFEGLKWWFFKYLEGSFVGWVIEGFVDMMIVIKKGYWEIRILYFNYMVE